MPGLGRAIRFVMPSPHSGSRASSTKCDRLGHQPRVVEQLPEAIRGSREMMPRFGRADAGVDADKQHPHAGLDAVLQSQRLPGGFRFFTAVRVRALDSLV